jgi:peptide/nickel transport system substrate-binding protein
MPRVLTIAQTRAALFDPQDCTDSADSLALLEAVFDPLVRRVGPGRFVAGLAEEWVQEDARRTLFRLRPGATFHDGTACDAAAVAASLMRMADPAVGATLGAPGVWAQYLAGCTVEVVNSRTLRLVTTKDIADILDVVSAGPVMAAAAIAATDMAGRWIGTGPWRLGSAEDGAIAMAPVRPGLPALRWIGIAEAEGRLAALRSGAVDVATRVGAGADGFETADVVDPTAIICLLNAAQGPCADGRVRRALAMAIDRAAMIAAVTQGAADPLVGFVSDRHFGFDPGAPGVAFDPAGARALLAEAGYAGGLALVADWPTRLPDEAPVLLPVLQAQLAAVGVALTARIEPDRVRYAERVRASDIADLCLFDSSPLSTFRVLAEKIDSRVAGSWWLGYRNPEVEGLIDQARTLTDTAAREALYRRCYRLLQQDPPWLTFYTHRRVAAGRGGLAFRDDGVLDVRAISRSASS